MDARLVEEGMVGGLVGHPVGDKPPLRDAPLTIPAGVFVDITARDEQVARCAVLAGAVVPRLEIAFPARGVRTGEGDRHLSQLMVRGTGLAEEFLDHWSAMNAEGGDADAVYREGLAAAVKPAV